MPPPFLCGRVGEDLGLGDFAREDVDGVENYLALGVPAGSTVALYF